MLKNLTVAAACTALLSFSSGCSGDQDPTGPKETMSPSRSVTLAPTEPPEVIPSTIDHGCHEVDGVPCQSPAKKRH